MAARARRVTRRIAADLLLDIFEYARRDIGRPMRVGDNKGCRRCDPPR
jgi:hypothetical protein